MLEPIAYPTPSLLSFKGSGPNQITLRSSKGEGDHIPFLIFELILVSSKTSGGGDATLYCCVPRIGVERVCHEQSTGRRRNTPACVMGRTKLIATSEA